MSIFSSNKDKNQEAAPVAPPVSSPSPSYSAPQPSYSSSSMSSGNNLCNISEGTIIDGHIRVEGDLRIEGNVKGTVTSKGKVTLSNSGKVDGDIICQHADISGKVAGKLKIADTLLLKGNATIEGDIQTGKLVMESGVKFNGNCSMGVVTKVENNTASAASTASSSSAASTTSGNTIKLNA